MNLTQFMYLHLMWLFRSYSFISTQRLATILLAAIFLAICMAFMGFIAVLFELSLVEAGLGNVLELLIDCVNLLFYLVLTLGLYALSSDWLTPKWRIRYWLMGALIGLFQTILLTMLFFIKIWRVHNENYDFLMKESEDLSLVILIPITLLAMIGMITGYYQEEIRSAT